MSVQKMSARQLARLIMEQESLFILDVRNEDDYADWKIEGVNVRSINKPYFELLDGIEEIAAQLPKDENILVVCAKEGSSKFVAEQLAEAGFDRVSYLEDGMASWSEHLEPVKIGTLPSGGEVYQFVRLGKGCLSYAVVADGEALVVDANRMIGVYETFAAEKKVMITHVVDTHLHADHVSGGRHLAERAGATYWLPAPDAGDVTYAYKPLQDGQVLEIGAGAGAEAVKKVTVEAIHTPGHTIGSTSLIVGGKYLLTGDTLFVASIGRPDLAGQATAWADDLRATLYERFKALPHELVVLPGHFAEVSELNEDGSVQETLGQLYAHNKGLTITDDAQFHRAVTENLPPQPHAYEQIRMTNKGQTHPDAAEQREMEIGPNRCAVHE